MMCTDAYVLDRDVFLGLLCKNESALMGESDKCQRQHCELRD